MKRMIVVSTILLAFATTFTAAPAFAQSPHFVSTSGAAGANGELVVSFKEAGLGNGQTIDYSLSANASATYGCVNGGGNHPKATNKETVSGPVGASGSFTASRNGNISQSLTLIPPGPGSSFSCPGGQTLELGTVSYSDVEITDITNNISQAVGTGTFTVTVNSF